MVFYIIGYFTETTDHLAQKKTAVGRTGPVGANRGLYSPSKMSIRAQDGGGTWRRIKPWLTSPREDLRSCDSTSW